MTPLAFTVTPTVRANLAKACRSTSNLERFRAIFQSRPASKSNGKLLTYFLSEVEGGNAEGHFRFTTRQVHGIWYTFDGKVFRGAASNATQDGYYMMDGTLATHDDVQKITQNKTISLKLTAMR